MITIGNGCGFWGDDTAAPERLVRLTPHLDVLTLDYLSELSLSILADQREKDPSLGYARDCLEVIKSLVPHFKKRRFLLITNGGGFNPIGLAEKVKAILPELNVAAIVGDDVQKYFPHLYTAHAYIGAGPVVEAIQGGADIVIAGRLADPSMTLAPLIAHYGWKDLDLLAAGTLAGHLIECSTQVTGGLREDWLALPHLADMGYPLVEVFQDGRFVVTKPAGTGGRVDKIGVALQMVYEIGDPGCYLSPDITANFLEVDLRDIGLDRVEVTGAKGSPPPTTLKVGGTYKAGFQAKGELALYGGDVKAKGEGIARVLFDRLHPLTFDHVEVSLSGFGGIGPFKEEPKHLQETILRIAVRSENKEALEAFNRSFAPFVTGGPSGVTGYTNGRGKIRPLYGFWSGLIQREKVVPEVVWM